MVTRDMRPTRIAHFVSQLYPPHPRGRARPELIKGWLWPDLVAGLTAAAVVIPMAMAYAGLADLPPQVGLYTVLVPMAVYVLLGSSRVLSVSTTTTLGILTATALKEAVPSADPIALASAAALLAMLVGALLILAAILRLGMLANFISDPVLTGFKGGVGCAILVNQIPKLIGLPLDKGWFGHNLAVLLAHLGDAKPATASLGLSLLAILFVLRHFLPRLPAPIIIISLVILLAPLIDYTAHGIAQIGPVSGGLPLPSLPNIDGDWPQHLLDLLPAAAGIALMSFTETIAAGRAFAAPNTPQPRPNRELVATGLASLIGGLFGAMPSGGGTTQTVVNDMAGARSQVAATVTAACAALVLLFLAPLVERLPQAALAAVVIGYSIGLINPRELRAILKVRQREFFWALIALFGVLILGTMRGIIVAVAASLLSLAHQTNNPPVYVLARKRDTDVFRAFEPQKHAGDETFEGLSMLRIEGRLYFGNSQAVVDHIMTFIHHPYPTVVALDLSAIFDIEYTALKCLIEIDDKLQARGIILWLAGLNPAVLPVIARTEIARRMDAEGRLAEGHIGKGRLFHNMEEVVTAYIGLDAAPTLTAGAANTQNGT